MVEVLPHNPFWMNDFATERTTILGAIGSQLVALHHIGSTAIAGIYAKPVIDMLAVAPTLDALDAAAPALTALGYQVMGEFGIDGRRYFRKDDGQGRRTHQLHAFACGSPQIDQHLAFRDYLRAHPAIAQNYSALKQKLAATSADYVEGKAPFVLATLADALAWYEVQPRGY